MKKFLLLSMLIPLLTFSNCNSYKKAMIDQHLGDVLKTQNQLIPKLCRYMVITGVKKEEFNLAKSKIELALRANSTINENLYIYVDEKQEAKEDILKLINSLKDTSHNVSIYSDEKNMLSDILTKKGSNNKLDYRRILLLTSSKNMRTYYAKLIDKLEDNKQEMVIDNFAYLYKTTREEYENPSKEEIKEVYKQINCN